MNVKKFTLVALALMFVMQIILSTQYLGDVHTFLNVYRGVESLVAAMFVAFLLLCIVKDIGCGKIRYFLTFSLAALTSSNLCVAMYYFVSSKVFAGVLFTLIGFSFAFFFFFRQRIIQNLVWLRNYE